MHSTLTQVTTVVRKTRGISSCVLAIAFLLITNAAARAQIIRQFGLNRMEASPMEVLGGESFDLTVTLTHFLDLTPGLAVVFESGDVGVAPFAPRNAFVLKPLTTYVASDFPTRPVPIDTPVELRATAAGRSVSATLMVLAPRVASVTIDPSRLTSGETGTGLVVLTGPAPSTGFAVDLASSDPATLAVPQFVVVAPGATAARFSVVTGGVNSVRNVNVTASSLSSPVAVSVAIVPAEIETFLVEPDSVFGGEQAIGQVALNGVAPFGGATIQLRSDNPAAVVPPEVVVPEGLVNAHFVITTRGVPAATSARIQAEGPGGSRFDSLRITPPRLEAIELFPAVVRGGRDVMGRASLTSAASPGGVAVEISSSDPAIVPAPAAIQVPPGESVAEFTLKTNRVVGRREVVINGRIGAGAQVTAKLVVETPITGDWDDDGDRDLSDTVALQACFTGAGTSASTTCAAVFDSDGDGDVDLADVLEFQQGYTGAGDSPTMIRASVDSGFEAPHPPLPNPFGGAPRPVAAMTDLTGIPTHFVENEVVLTTDDPAVLVNFLVRWNGIVVQTLVPSDFGVAGAPVYLIRILQPAPADPAEMSQNLQEIHPLVRGELRFADEVGMDLVALAAQASADGIPVALNWISSPTDIPGGSTSEASSGSDLDGPGPDFYSRDAFQWWPLTGIFPGTGASQIPNWPTNPHGVTSAWQYLNRTGDDTARVGLAVIDGGFMMNDPDMPADQIALSTSNVNALGTPNPTPCSGGNACPWHGTGCIQTAAAVIDNNVGTAGTGGQVVQPITIHTGIDDFSIIQALILARANGARVVSMSFSRRIPAAGVAFTETWNDVTLQASRAGVVLFASAGNSGQDVDEEDCFGGSFCWEAAWHAPCENEGVICVGGLRHGSIAPHPSSNYGTEEVDLFAPWCVNSGARPAGSGDPTGASGTIFCGTSASTPYAAGVAAMMLAADPSLTPGDIAFLLRATAHEAGNYKVGKRAINAGEAVYRAIGDLPPQVQIVSPQDGDTVDNFDAEFRAEASDREDGSVTITWSSNRQGNLGTGSYLLLPNLDPGAHIITASVVDSMGQGFSDSITVFRFDTPPTLDIIEPLAGQNFVTGETIAFRGNSYDLDQFQQGRLPNARVSWSAVRTGGGSASFGTGHEISVQIPSPGTWTVRFTARDETGQVQLAVATVGITVGPTPADLPPTVNITVPATDITIQAPSGLGTNNLFFAGSASDPEDGPLSGSSMVWTSSIDGLLGTGASIVTRLSASNCGIREHTITLTVTDSAGNVRSRIRRVNVARPPC